MKSIIIVFLLASSALHICNAQIVNVESLRRISDSSKWSVSGSLDVGLIKNTSSIFRVNNRIRLQYNSKNNVYLFINDLNLQKIEDNSFVNRGTQHLRYNRKLGERIKFEAFAQSQYDAVSNIKFRGLLGIGPRFKLSKNKNFRYYLGTLLMYEIEEALDNSIEILRDLRGSTYFSCSLYPLDNLSIVSTTYYQPLLKQFSDFRISNETSVAFRIVKNLAFKITFIYNFDAEPIVNIPKVQYELTNGLIYSFD
jgi:putative salt-induced outer membrane protein YdiY